MDKWEVRTRKEEGGKYILPDVARSIRAKMEEMGLNLRTDLAGIGLGVPGPVLPDGFVEVCVNLGWRQMCIRDSLYILAWESGVKTLYYVRSKSLEVEECESCSS